MPDEAPRDGHGPGSGRHLVLSFDYGKRRIGVACGDSVSRAASPLGGVPAGLQGPHWGGIDKLIDAWGPAMLVVGLPYNADGSEGATAGAARSFAAELGKRYSLPVKLVDERYSSLEAQQRLKGARESGMRKRRVTKVDIDAAAACVILERWFDENT
jgi:putative Holliday junction resolvase